MKQLSLLVVIVVGLHGWCMSQDKSKNVIKSIHEAPVSHSEYKLIKGGRESAYDVKSGNIAITPVFIDPVLSVAELAAFCSESNSKGYNSIRFYPGLLDSSKVVLIMCAAKSSDSLERNYHILKFGDYTNKFKLDTARATFDEALALHKAYLSMVRIDGKTQPAHGLTDSSFRKSRLYAVSEITTFLDSNIAVAGYGNYKIKFETGIVPDALLDVFQGRFQTGDRLYHKGFTVLMHILDENHVPVINPYLEVEMNSPNPYKNLYLEVGNPCPPRCGVMHND